MKIYHWNGAGNKNFGDILGPYIVEKLTKHNVEWAKPEESDAVIIGSIMELMPKQYEGIVAGIGIGLRKTLRDLTKADVRALRGKYTLKNVKTKNQNILLADPGLLAPYVVDVSDVDKEYKHGVILHYGDSQNVFDKNYNHIDIKSGIENVIREAAKCEKIITSSLHGVILADSLGLPRKWVPFDKVQGGGLKFADYNSSIDLHPLKNVWRTADKNIIKKKQEKLLEMITCL